ncbi:hypothetical protein KC980_01155 [candidate division WWE3 bacterium]|uniref:Phosphoribosyltransferase domain-containing protein n=1 Tax=candidate division WWE3 bacterium TaxID=2053526 RepID=A0A955ECJ8_UNCKA|nr:hypothetical protein [candidate division WWE3 bacterium]
MNALEVASNTKSLQDQNLKVYYDNEHFVYNNFITEAYNQLKSENIKLVVCILKSAEIPANDLASKLNVPITYVEYHKKIEGTGNFTYPNIKTSKVDYPVNLGGKAKGENAYEEVIPFNSKQANIAKILEEIQDLGGKILVVDDFTTLGHNCILASKQIRDTTNLTYKNLIYYSLTKSVHSPINSPKGFSSIEIGYCKTFHGIIVNCYGWGKFDNEKNILDGALVFSSISGTNTTLEQYLSKLQNGRKIYAKLPIYY